MHILDFKMPPLELLCYFLWKGEKKTIPKEEKRVPLKIQDVHTWNPKSKT